MAADYLLMVTLCTTIAVSGSSNFTLSTDEISWFDAREACGVNNSILSGRVNSTQIDGMLREANVSDVWMPERTFLSEWLSYKGCHVGDLSDTQGVNVTSPKLGRCRLHCQSNGSKYFILQDKDVCKCLKETTASQLNRTHDSNCNITCGEGLEQATKCGGTGRDIISLYTSSSYGIVDSSEDMCLVFQNINGTVVLQPEPCNSNITTTACVTYNETIHEDEIKITEHNIRCRNGYLPGLDNTTRMALLNTTDKIWSGDIRQRINVDDIDLELDNMTQCYALENGTRVRSNCTEHKRYICENIQSIDESEIEESTTETTITSDKAPTTEFQTTTLTTTTTTLSGPRKSNRENTKVITIAAGIAVGCVVLVVVSAIVITRVCKRTGKKKGRKKKPMKQQPIILNEIVRNSDSPEDSLSSDSDESEPEQSFKVTTGNSTPMANISSPSKSVTKFNYDTVNEIGGEKCHDNDAYASAETTSKGSDEGLYHAMDLVDPDEEGDDHIYSHTMLPLPDPGNSEDVSETHCDAYDVMNAKVKGQGNDSAYDHTNNLSPSNGTSGGYDKFNRKGKDTVEDTYDHTDNPGGGAGEGYDVFNGKVKGPFEDTYDHTHGDQNKNAGLSTSEYDVFNRKPKDNDYSSTDMYDHTKNVHTGSLSGEGGEHNMYDTCNAKSKFVDDVDDMYDHAKHTRENVDDNLYDLTSKRKNVPSVADEDPYDHV